jgi:competence protein ComEC
MAQIHFLNVLEGDCNIIKHDAGNRVTVIDVSNAYNEVDTPAEAAAKASAERKARFSLERNYVPLNKSNYRQKETPDNPITYLKKLGISEIWRFIVTHPDMDHLDGIKDLFDEFTIPHTWDTDNKKVIADTSNSFGGYNREDWDFYTNLRDGKNNKTKRLTNYAPSEANYWTDDNLKILCPTPELLASANEAGDWNDSSYVLLFTPPKANGGKWKILFAGDSHDDSWEYILDNYKSDVENIDILFAPHHGRDSNRSYDFLETLNPSLTLFGNASSKHLAYDCYPETRITNNQAGYVIIDCQTNGLNIYVKNYEFMKDFRAKRGAEPSAYNNALEAYFLYTLR